MPRGKIVADLHLINFESSFPDNFEDGGFNRHLSLVLSKSYIRAVKAASTSSPAALSRKTQTTVWTLLCSRLMRRMISIGRRSKRVILLLRSQWAIPVQRRNF